MIGVGHHLQPRAGDAVGMITGPGQAQAVVASGRADAVLLGRVLLRDPYWARPAATALVGKVTTPVQYHRAWRRRRSGRRTQGVHCGEAGNAVRPADVSLPAGPSCQWGSQPLTAASN